MITPHQSYPNLAKSIGVTEIYFKREDLHPYGSHKGRSIPVMIDRYYSLGERNFAISSSGNAALAAALYTKEINKIRTEKIILNIFIGQKINPQKKAKLESLGDENIKILTKENPLQALTQATQEGFRSLRQSTDDTALKGYLPLAEELSKIKKIGAVFIGTSSGTTAQALADYFIKNNLPIQVHVIQTSSCHPMSEVFEYPDTPDEISLAGAVVDRTAYRKDKLITLIKETDGYGWTASNEDILAAQDFTKKYSDLDISTNSALSVVGVMKAAEIGHNINGAIVCIICGE